MNFLVCFNKLSNIFFRSNSFFVPTDLHCHFPQTVVWTNGTRFNVAISTEEHRKLPLTPLVARYIEISSCRGGRGGANFWHFNISIWCCLLTVYLLYNRSVCLHYFCLSTFVSALINMKIKSELQIHWTGLWFRTMPHMYDIYVIYTYLVLRSLLKHDS